MTERAHWQVFWLKTQRRTAADIAAVTGYTSYWVRTLIHRYNAGGPDALADRRRAHPGAKPMLDAQQQGDLRAKYFADAALAGGRAPDGGARTGPKVARWIEQATGRARVHDQRGWDYMVRLGFSSQTPRPRRARTTCGLTRPRKRRSKNTLAPGVAAARTRRPVELWAMDEHRVGLKPILRRVWARKGERLQVHVRPRYEWLYVYAFVCPTPPRVWTRDKGV